MGKVTYFEITADDLDRSIQFYAEAFGWKFKDQPFVGGYKLAATGTGSGIDGAIMKRDYSEQPVIPWIEVDDIDEAIQKVGAAGGKTIQEKHTIPGIGHVVYIVDTEGNQIGLQQPLK